MISSRFAAKDHTHLYTRKSLKDGDSTGKRVKRNALLWACSHALSMEATRIRQKLNLFEINVCDNTRYRIYRQGRLSCLVTSFPFFLTHYSEHFSVLRGCSDARKEPTGDQARQPLTLHITNNNGKTPSIKCLTDHFLGHKEMTVKYLSGSPMKAYWHVAWESCHALL